MLANFAVALAIVAAAAEATEWGGDFGSYGSKSQLHSRSGPSYHPRSSRYGSHTSSYSPKSSGYDSHSTGYSHGHSGLDSGDFAHGITSWAKKNTRTAGAQYGGQGQNPGYPTRGSYHSERAAPVRHYDDEEAYPEHSYNFNPRPVAHKPAATHAPAQHHGYSAYAPKSSYGHGYSHAAPSYSHAAPSHSHQSYTPAAATPVAAAEYDGSWWTPNQQYSPPLIKYVVAAGIPAKGLFAKCPIVPENGSVPAGVGDVTGDILFSQLPGQTIKVTGTFTQQVPPASTVSFGVLMDGDIKTDATAANCVSEALEFNPLAEIKDGVTNPYADPARGKIDSLIVPTEVGADLELDQNDFLQNLAGHDSIIGRAVIVSTTGPTVMGLTPPSVDKGCCVIARTNDPSDAPEASSIWLRPRVVATAHNHHYNSYPSQSHSNYGGYGGYHH